MSGVRFVDGALMDFSSPQIEKKSILSWLFILHASVLIIDSGKEEFGDRRHKQ